MSIRKSETFSQTEIFFTISLDITKINKKSFDAKVCNDGKEVVVFPKNNRRFFFFLNSFGMLTYSSFGKKHVADNLPWKIFADLWK